MSDEDREKDHGVERVDKKPLNPQSDSPPPIPPDTPGGGGNQGGGVGGGGG